MRQFFTNTNARAYDDLEERAKGACIRFRNQAMPPGCTPSHADVGFEIDRNSGESCLYVSTGIDYQGPDPEVRDWLRNGVKRFSSFSELKAWIMGPLQQAYRNSASQFPVPAPAATASRLTDMPAVHAMLQGADRTWHLDEEKLFDRLRRKVLGQDAALKGLCSVVARHCAKVHPQRPAVLFTIGPSGVGKTRAAEMLARELQNIDDAGHGYQFLRLDMAEYQEAHRVSQLLGAPQGYVGHGEGSQLVDALRANPRTIVLFDEIEKAHPAILRVLMNAMDAGRLSTPGQDSGSREIDCRHAVFMFTSNIDAEGVLGELESRNGFGDRVVEDEVCRRRLRAAGIATEIVGRIGRFLVFRPLSPEIQAEIMALVIAEVAAEYGLHVSRMEPSVVSTLMTRLQSRAFGVRPARYLVDDELGKAFAEAARKQASSLVVIVGPPYACVASTSERPGADTVPAS